MEVGKLTVKHRTKTGKGVARKLRAQGRLPGICYGGGIEQPITIDFESRAFHASLDSGKRQNTVIALTIEADGQPARNMPVMIKDYQIDPLRREITHVDFVAVDTSQEVTAEVPLEFTGKSKGVVAGGTLHVVRRAVEIRCRPADIPSQIEVDITELGSGDVLHVSDLKLPAGASAATPAQLTVVTCVAPEGAGEEEAAEGEAAG